MLFELLAGGILASVFIPLFMERLQDHGEQDAWKFASYVLNILICVGAVALVATIWPEPFVRSQTLTISAERASLRSGSSASSPCKSCSMAWRSSSPDPELVPPLHRSDVGPIFNNVVVTVTLLAFYVPLRSPIRNSRSQARRRHHPRVVTMAAVQIPTLMRHKFRYTLRIDWHHPDCARSARRPSDGRLCSH